MIFEVLTFCRVSEIFFWLKREYREEIAEELGLDDAYLASWLHALVEVRNVCAHHNRLWNKRFKNEPLYHNDYAGYLHFIRNNKFYSMAVVMQVFLQKTTEDPHWSGRLKYIFKRHDKVPIIQMGFPQNWASLPLWDNHVEQSMF